MLKRITVTVLTALMIFTVSTTAMAADTKKFSDVSSTDWYYNSINYLVSLNGINGFPDGTFKPNDTMTYAEFIKTCISASTATTYTSKDGEPWYQAAYQACLDKGVFTAEEVTATELTTTITREDMALILVRTARIVKGEASVDTTGVSAKIADASKISSDRTTYVYQAYKMGMLQGSYGNFKPTTSATRAECSTVIHRLMETSVRLSYRRIIAQLRDGGVIISSSVQGYKIPTCVDDITTYLNQTNLLVSPMLDRVEICRKLIYQQTDVQLDILDNDAFAKYKKYFD